MLEREFDAMSPRPLERYIEDWRGLTKRWPDRTYEMSAGFKMFDYVALEILEAHGEVWVKWGEGLFGGTGRKQS